MENQKIRMKTIRVIVCFLGMLCVAGLCFGQEEQDNRNINKPNHSRYDDYIFPRFVLFYGNGINEQARPAEGAVSADPRKLTNFGLALEGGISLEIGYLGPSDGSGSSSGIFFSSGIAIPPIPSISQPDIILNVFPHMSMQRQFDAA